MRAAAQYQQRLRLRGPLAAAAARLPASWRHIDFPLPAVFSPRIHQEYPAPPPLLRPESDAPSRVGRVPGRRRLSLVVCVVRVCVCVVAAADHPVCLHHAARWRAGRAPWAWPVCCRLSFTHATRAQSTR